MQYFVYGRDRTGAGELKGRLTPEHWAFMDGYAAELIARGPTLTPDGEDTTGSLHIIDLPTLEAVKTFAYDDPYYRAGVFESVLITRFRNHTGATMWDFANAVDGYHRYLVHTDDAPRPLTSPHLILYGDLLALDADEHLGRAVLLEAPDAVAAAALADADLAQVHPWTFGGRR
ncbi:YciI family protein [Kribbella sp. NPDC005582]|uniref:YciI family protein n=1 Tax=Kribbella sp. NPDC005582 TaxID=3156893 RepID=UPI0033BE0BE8